MSEALILASTNPQYDDRLWHSEPFMYTTCSELGIFMYWSYNSINNLLSYWGLVDTGISASDKDLSVRKVVSETIVCSIRLSKLEETLQSRFSDYFTKTTFQFTT